MNLDQIVALYLEANVALVAGTCLSAAMGVCARLRLMKYRDAVSLGILGLMVIISYPLVSMLIPTNVFFPPTSQIWNGSTGGSSQFFLSVSTLTVTAAASLNEEGGMSGLLMLFGVVLLAGWGYFAYGIFRGMKGLRQLLQSSTVIHEFRGVYVGISQMIAGPLSFRTRGLKVVLLPMDLCERQSGDSRISRRHEFQHHRQGDTRVVFLFEVFRLLFWINPAAHIWINSLSQQQELACDEAMVDQFVSPQAYGRCLIRAAETMLDSRRPPFGTAGMASSSSSHLLRRRISMLYLYQKQTNVLTRSLSLIVALALSASTAFAVRGLVKDGRVTMEHARGWLETARKGSEFPLVLNERVLTQLNRLIGTPSARKKMRENMRRMEVFRKMIESALGQYSLPVELLAIPIVESGFRNLSPHLNPVGGAGIWQFIAATARHYNLQVDEEVDERLDVVLETDAAMRFLSSLNLRFQDWGLAVLGYNSGERTIQKGINLTGSESIIMQL